jgi:hypothetical protein
VPARVGAGGEAAALERKQDFNDSSRQLKKVQGSNWKGCERVVARVLYKDSCWCHKAGGVLRLA